MFKKTNGKKKRIVAVVLSFILVFCSVSPLAFAEDSEPENTYSTSSGLSFSEMAEFTYDEYVTYMKTTMEDAEYTQEDYDEIMSYENYEIYIDTFKRLAETQEALYEASSDQSSMSSAPLLTDEEVGAYDAKDQNEIGVVYNGEYIKFKDVKPKMVNNRTMIPFQAIMDEVGAKTDYDHTTKIISASYEGTDISFKAGSKKINVTKAGETTVIESEAAPYIDQKTNRTMVPVRFVTEAFGLHVSWDSWGKEVVIINITPLLENAEEECKIAEMVIKDLRTSAKYNDTGTITANFEYGGQTGKISASYKAAQDEYNSNFNMTFTADITKLIAENVPYGVTVGVMYDALQKEFLTNSSLDMKIDGENKIIYIKGDILAILLNDMSAKNKWYKYDLLEEEDYVNELERSGKLVSILFERNKDGSEIGAEEILEALISYYYLDDYWVNRNTYASIESFYEAIRDDNFVTTEKNNTKTHVYTYEEVDFEITVSIREENGVFKDLTATGNIEDLYDDATFNLVMSPEKYTLKITFEHLADMDSYYDKSYKIDCTINGSTTPTTVKADVSLPNGIKAEKLVPYSFY